MTITDIATSTTEVRKEIIAMSKWILLVFLLTSNLLAQNESLLIGPGDQVHVQVFDTPELDENARVTDDGELPLILGGKIRLVSLTPVEAARSIEAALVQARVMNYPRVLVTVTQFATQNVTVFGQVVRPGTYPIDTPRSVVDVLGLAGGLTDLADRHITIERHTNHRQVSYYVSNHAGDFLDQTVMVNPGDKVLVPKAGIVYVLGDVGRPGGYPMTNNDATLTVLQAVAAAGGTASSAVPSHTKLIRRTAVGGYQSDPVPLSDMQKGKKPDMALQAGDIVYIPFSYIRNAALGLTGIAAAATSAVIYTK
jgi:polysaccharide biosynthesis/export protein